ncbi:methyltransferase domain-containing protein [Sporichthya brevicatena]|uniref:Methyltransferase domain-containing protein n=1 Tax=Sporichthya brevicatena TaxID=171442 RepID=A0ABN1G952_9ACTN
MNTPRVDPANAESLRTWDGTDGEYWATNADAFDATLAAYMEPFFETADLRPAERVLDIGCGCGRTTIDAARRTSPGRAMGVDLSAAMLDVARHRAQAEQVANIEFVQADAQVYHFEPGGFDVVLSRFGVMFFADPPTAFANIARALRPGGRVLFAVWQSPAHNTWMQVIRDSLAMGRDLPAPPPDAPGPTSLADPDRVRHLLTGAGLHKVKLTGVRRPACFGTDLESAYEFVSGQPCVRFLLKDLDDAARAEGLAALRATIAEHLTGDGLLLDSAAWFVTAVRH